MEPTTTSALTNFHLWREIALLVIAVFGFLAGIIASIFALGRMRSTLISKSEIYDEKGKRIYKGVEMCDKERGECQTMICKKIDVVNKKLDNIVKEEKEKEVAFAAYKESIRQELSQVSFFMGEISGLLKSGGIEIKNPIKSSR